MTLELSSLQGPSSSAHATGILLPPAQGPALPRKSPLPHHKPPNLPLNSVPTLHGTSSLPWSSALSADHFHRHLQPSSLPSSSASLHQQVSHSHSWGLPALGTLLAAGEKCAPQGANMPHRVLPAGRAARQGQPWWVLPRVHPKSCFEGSRTDSSLVTVVIRKSFSDSCLCTSHLKAVSDEATSCPSSTTSPRAGAHGGMRHFPVSVGGDAAAKHGWHIRHPATCTPGAMDSILPRAQSRALLLPPVPSPGV